MYMGVLLDYALCLRWMRQLVSGLGAIHDIAVHRDIKPRNVMVAVDVLKIIDFGMARFDADDTITEARGKGSRTFKAPETWRAEHGSSATDIYALGILFYQLVTLTPPYVADTDDELRELHEHGPVPRPSTKRPSLDPRANSLIMGMMAHDPVARPTLTQIEQILDEVALNPSPPLPGGLQRIVHAAETTQTAIAQKVAHAQAQHLVHDRHLRHATQGIETLAADLDFLIRQLNTQIHPPIARGEENIPTTETAPLGYRVIKRRYAYNGRHLDLFLQGMPFQNIGPDGQPVLGLGHSALAFGTVGITYQVLHALPGGYGITSETPPHGFHVLLDEHSGTEEWWAYAIDKTGVPAEIRRPIFDQLTITQDLIDLLRAPNSEGQNHVVRPLGRVNEQILTHILAALVGDGLTEENPPELL